MNSENPYRPVQTPTPKGARNDRPYYLYATAVVLLFWAGIYMYLQSQYSESADSQTIYFWGYASRMYYVNVPTLIALLALSLAFVNTALWAALKLRR